MSIVTFHNVSYAQVASLAFFLYDYCLTFGGEVNHIWPKPNGSWVKWHFLFIRYFALATQLLNRTVEWMAYEHGIQHDFYRVWYMLQVVLGCVLMTSVELILMVRVYALYDRKTWVIILFLFLVLGEFTVVAVGIALNPISDELAISNVMLMTPISYTYFGISAIASQIAILVLTLAKYHAAIRGGWAKEPILALMVRDGTLIFLILLVISTMVVIETTLQTQCAPLGNSWFIAIVSCSGCRLIINLQTMPLRTLDIPTHFSLTSIQLTGYLGPPQESEASRFASAQARRSVHPENCNKNVQ